MTWLQTPSSIMKMKEVFVREIISLKNSFIEDVKKMEEYDMQLRKFQN